VTRGDENSRRTRVEPVFGWLRDCGGRNWPERLVEIADGIRDSRPVGELVAIEFEKERRVPPSAARLTWMIENVDRLAPVDGRQWREYRRRITDNPKRDVALTALRRGDPRGLSPSLKLEGYTSADCLIECEHAFVWIEGKRNDWLEYSATWDVTRDQLARNAEAAWLVATEHGKRSLVLVCHEHALKHHEEALLAGYREGTWSAGWPHLSGAIRGTLGAALGTLTWEIIVAEWPGIRTRLP
jgi:hypothetical protein